MLKGENMKKNFYLCLFLVFALLLQPGFNLTKAATAKNPVPQAKLMTPKSTEMSPDKPEVVVEKSKYALPYPGILPDHPLYFLKNLRDVILDKLIADPVRRAEFNLLQADKKLQMGLGLLNKGNEKLGFDFLNKAEKHMETSIYGLVNYKASGKEVPGYMVERLVDALGKHLEVLQDFLINAKAEQKQTIDEVYKLAQKLQGELGKLR